MANQKLNEGWSDDVSRRNGRLAHYYKDGKSLCGKWEMRHYMKYTGKGKGSKYSMQCMRCEKRREKLINP